MKQQIITAIAEVSNHASVHVTPESRLEDDLLMDSLHLAELQLQLEDDLEIELPDDKYTECKTVQDIIDLAGQQLAVH